ncbi:hypothetical protein Psal011_02264 [Piscirickettsia salmonis]|uniref:hypothetical protein n=1 Tax=Piscirickettsia salmonis TaxID=1238 RepID=UPI0012BA0DDF|nr:hypothetical protein [Piscirickettsia salmonis]QGO17046.1 hypothetical protein Psal011_02264 [Piscirickettsia salmonis]
MKQSIKNILNNVNSLGKDTKSALTKIQTALSHETKENKQMLETYAFYLAGKTTKEEMKHANEQFRQLLKTLGLGTFLVLPGSVITLPLIIMLGKKFGIHLLPEFFHKQFPEIKPEDRKRRYLGRYFAHPMMQNRRAKRDDYKPSAVRVTQRCVP